jgi:hypothetical protein
MSMFMLRTGNFAVAALVAGLLLFPQDAGKSPSVSITRQAPPTHVAIAKIAPRTEDVSTIDGMIKAYYEIVSGPAGQPRQWDRDATLYIPGVRFVIISEDAEGKATAQSMTHQQFVDSSETSMKGKAFYEHEIHRVTNRVGNIAHVLSTGEHTSSPNGPVEGRGIDSLELFWDGQRWWIAGANLWEINTKTHPLPSEYLP